MHKINCVAVENILIMDHHFSNCSKSLVKNVFHSQIKYLSNYISCWNFAIIKSQTQYFSNKIKFFVENFFRFLENVFYCFLGWYFLYLSHYNVCKADDNLFLITLCFHNRMYYGCLGNQVLPKLYLFCAESVLPLFQTMHFSKFILFCGSVLTGLQTMHFSN